MSSRTRRSPRPIRHAALSAMFPDLCAALPEFDGFHSSALVEGDPEGQELALFVRRATAALVGRRFGLLPMQRAKEPL